MQNPERKKHKHLLPSGAHEMATEAGETWRARSGGGCGMGAGGLVAGLRVGMPVDVLPPWGVIAVAAPWPMGTQAPL